MASWVVACRASTRLAMQRMPHDVASRGFRTSATRLAAQNFTMPALSPTMTEGTIASWRVKEGDKFSAGDVLLEIETDKATMDVEAQEDGILMKIFQRDGSKGVQVGSRIAVLAEEGDDISALEIPADASPTSHAKGAASSEPPPSPELQVGSPQPATKKSTPKAVGKAPTQTYPLMPSVAHLIKENGLDDSAVDDMTPTGPNGRLLKGDVLAYLGKINVNTPADISSRFDKASHLNLDNIKVAKAPERKYTREAAPETPRSPETSLSLSISLLAVVGLQKKVHDTLGVSLPLSTFIARATDLANDELPMPSGHQPTTDELFDQVLGSGKSNLKTSRGAYLPHIAPLPPSSQVAPRPKQTDNLIDFLASSRPASARRSAIALRPGLCTGANVFSLQVPWAETKRAQAFLERMKLVLENEPGRLVL